MRRVYILFSILTILPLFAHANQVLVSCNAGISPGTVAICGEPVCLFGYLGGNPDPGGVWVGPAGWVADYCGTFDPQSDPEGDYAYFALGGDGEMCSSVITVTTSTPIDMGIMEYIVHCFQSYLDLNNAVTTSNELPDDGNWYYPNTFPNEEGIIPDGLIHLSQDPEGEYAYAFTNEQGCNAMARAHVLWDPFGHGGTETWINLTPDLQEFCPFDYLEGSPTPGGDWVHYNADGNFFEYFLDHNPCIPFEEIENGVRFTYILGAGPCIPSYTDLHINIVPENILTPDTAHAFCISTGELALTSLMQPGLEPGGIWINPAGVEISEIVNTESALSGTYIYSIIEGENAGYALLHLTISPLADAGSDVLTTFCGDGTPLDLTTILDPNADSEGVFSPSNIVELIPENAGVYTYTVPGNACPNDTAIYTLDIDSITDLGNIANLLHCIPTPIDLFQSVATPNGLSIQGNWYFPNTYPDPNGIVPEGTIDPASDPSGIYDYAYTPSGACVTTASVLVVFDPSEYGGIETWTEICSNSGVFSPFDALDGDPSPGGNWILYDSSGSFKNFYIHSDHVVNVSELEDGGYLTYVLGAFPCNLAYTDLHITLLPGESLAPDTSHSYCITTGEIMLDSLIASDIEPGGTWTNPAGDSISNIINSETAQAGIYTYSIELEDELCNSTALVNLDIMQPNAGPDRSFNLCPDGSEIHLENYVPSEADSDGLFETPIIIADEANAGTYTYTVTTETCGSDQAEYTFNFHELPAATNLLANCNTTNPTTYTVSFEAIQGLPPYSTSNGTFDDVFFTSNQLSVANEPEFVFLIEDQNGCIGEVSGAITDTDGDGICDDGEIVGCMNPESPNFNPFATDPGWCAAGGFEEAIDTPTEYEPEDTGGFGLVGSTGGLEHQWEFSVFPNPLQKGEQLQIALQNVPIDETFTLHCYDMTGRLVANEKITARKGSGLYPISFGNKLSGGTYIICLNGAKVSHQLLTLREQ